MADYNKFSVSGAGAEITPNAGVASNKFKVAKDTDIILYVLNTDAAAATIKVKAGVGQRSSLGDLSFAVAQNKIFAVNLSDTARFKDASGDITITITNANGSEYSGTVGNVKVTIIEG